MPPALKRQPGLVSMAPMAGPANQLPTKVLRYPEMRELYGLTEAQLLEYTLLLQVTADLVTLDPLFTAQILRDPTTFMSFRPPYWEKRTLSAQTTKISIPKPSARSAWPGGIEVRDEVSLLSRFVAH